MEEPTEEQWQALVQWAHHHPHLAPTAKYALVRDILDQRDGDLAPYARALRALERQLGVVEADAPR